MVYAILADDSTGAADAGIEFAQTGWRTRTLRHDWQPEHLVGAEVVVIDTQSRSANADAAGALVQRMAMRLRQANAEIVYKKIDSTLRGALGAELDALLTTCGHSLAIICPAFPACGRTLIDGVLRVEGVAVAHTATGGDALTPVYESHLPTLLSTQTQRPIHHFARPPSGFDPVTLAAQWRMLPPGALAVVDAADDHDLEQIAAASDTGTSGRLLLVGSAGLARPWSRMLAQFRHPRVLVVCGSLHPAARAQLRALQRHCDGQAYTLLATPEKPTSHAATQGAVQALATDAATWLASHIAAGIVVTGGDTLHALLTALGANGLDLEHTIAPGIALGRIAGGPWAGLRLVSKAGGFGQEDTLLHTVRYLSGNQE